MAQGITVLLTPADIEAIALAVVRKLREGKSPEVPKQGTQRPSLSESAPTILRDTEAAEMLGTTRKTLETWRCRGRGPKFVKIGRSVRYRMSDLKEYIACLTTG